VRVLIDGQEVDRESVLCLHQWEPFPGGHRFRVELPESEADADVLAQAGREVSTHAESNGLMLWLQWKVEASGGDIAVEWLLNRVTSLSRRRGTVIAEGVASPRATRNG
jgi:hypothetical protein